MKKIAIVDYNFTADWFLHLLGNFIIETASSDRPEKIIAWQSNQYIGNDIYEGIAKFVYNGAEFTYISGNPSVKELLKYDEICTIEHKFLLTGLNSYTFSKEQEPTQIEEYYKTFGNRVRRLIFNMEEPIPSEETDYEFFNNLSVKIVSTYSDDKLDKLDKKKFLYVPFISWLKFFYDKGYDYLNYDVAIKKQNLVGSYFIPNYKPERNYLIENINSILDLNDLKPVEVYKQSFPRTKSQKYIEYLKEHWQVNHATSYTDIGSSVVNIVFETKYYLGKMFTEKTLKALLFSKFSYNILYKRFEDLKFLKECGFWFLNFEYIDWDTKKSEPEIDEMIHDSIYRAIIEVGKVYKEVGDYESTFSKLDEKYYDKRIKNYELVKSYIVDPIYRNDIFDFLFEGLYQKQII